MRAARQILARRRLRETIFKSTLFGEPAWEMLLELYIRESSGASITTDELKKAAGGPLSTSARWLKMLERDYLIIRRPHPVDHGTEFVDLTSEAKEALETYLSVSERH